MGKFTTNSKKEARKNKDLIYIDPAIGSYIPKNKIPKRCKYCRCVLKQEADPFMYSRGVCSQWCLDFISPPTRYHPCPKCGKEKTPSLRQYKKKNGTISYISTGVYPTYCSDCTPYKKNKQNENQSTKVK